MPRILVAVAALVAALAWASAAQAAIPVPTVSVADASVRPSLLSGSETALVGGPTVIVDGFGLNPPTVIAAPGAAVTITTDMAIDAIGVWAGQVPLAALQTGERTYVATLPADLALPARLSIGLDATTATHQLRSAWTLNLVAAPVPAPVPTPDPAPMTAAVPRLGAVRIDGRRLTATITCASACAGTLTLKTPSLRVARIAFTRPGTMRATVRPAVLRQLARHRVKRLRAVLTPTGGAPVLTQVSLTR